MRKQRIPYRERTVKIIDMCDHFRQPNNSAIVDLNEAQIVIQASNKNGMYQQICTVDIEDIINSKIINDTDEYYLPSFKILLRGQVRNP